MNHSPQRHIEAYHDLSPTSYNLLRVFSLAQEETTGGFYELALTIVLGHDDRLAKASAMRMIFNAVSDLNIDWPSLSVIQSPVIEIFDISDRGLEDLYYRVSEGEGSFAFWCRDFQASLD